MANTREAAVMIGCFTVKRRAKLRPEVVLWRGVVLVQGQVLAQLARWDACPARGRTQIGDGCEQGVLPEVVGLPPGDLVEQIRSVPPCSAAATRTAYWSFLFCRPRNVHSGRNRSRIPSRSSGSVRLAPHQARASAERRRRTSPGRALPRGGNGARSRGASPV